MAEQEFITTSQLSKELGIKQRAIQKRLKALGIQPEQVGTVFILTIQQAELVRAAKNKPGPDLKPDGPSALARQLGVSTQRACQILQPHKHNARSEVAYALKTGRLIKPNSCSLCQALGSVEAHHADYAQPLNVTWLCRTCHGRMHRK